jgi:hypothetical protein
MEPESSTPSSQDTATDACSDPVASNLSMMYFNIAACRDLALSVNYDEH